eukprot:scpid19007/ scgid26981/ 
MMSCEGTHVPISVKWGARADELSALARFAVQLLFESMKKSPNQGAQTVDPILKPFRNAHDVTPPKIRQLFYHKLVMPAMQLAAHSTFQAAPAPFKSKSKMPFLFRVFV